MCFIWNRIRSNVLASTFCQRVEVFSGCRTCAPTFDNMNRLSSAILGWSSSPTIKPLIQSWQYGSVSRSAYFHYVDRPIWQTSSRHMMLLARQSLLSNPSGVSILDLKWSNITQFNEYRPRIFYQRTASSHRSPSPCPTNLNCGLELSETARYNYKTNLIRLCSHGVHFHKEK